MFRPPCAWPVGILQLTPIALAVLALAMPAGAEPAAPEKKDPAPKTETVAPTYLPGALKKSTSGAGVHGYGELHLNQAFGAGGSQADFHRLVFGFDAALADRIRFGSEIELEHGFVPAGATAAGELELEQAWLQFEFLKGDFSLSIAGGVLILPFGRMNTLHEPTEFFSVERPMVNTIIIPSTWSEPGLQLSGSFGDGFAFAFGVFAGLQGNGFSSASGIRGGRQKVNSARFTGGGDGSDITGLNFSGMFTYESPIGIVTSLSGFASRVDQAPGQPGASWAYGVALDFVATPPVPVLEALRFTATFAFIRIPKAGAISTALALPANNGIGEKLLGYYFEIAFNAFHFWTETTTKLWLFLRWEDYDTQNKVPAGFSENRANDRTALIFGAAFYPSANVAVKITYSDFQDVRGTPQPNDQLDFGFAFQF